MCGIAFLMEPDTHIGAVIPLSGHLYILALIQGINQRLMYFFIFFHIQRIDFHCRLKDFFKIFSDFRYRIGDNRKAVLLLRDIAVLYE